MSKFLSIPPEYTANADGLGSLRILEAIRFNKLEKTKFYQAGTSELYGKNEKIPQNEKTPFHPASPYGVAKLYSHWDNNQLQRSLWYLCMQWYSI